jgi:hypothetical protein
LLPYSVGQSREIRLSPLRTFLPVSTALHSRWLPSRRLENYLDSYLGDVSSNPGRVSLSHTEECQVWLLRGTEWVVRGGEGEGVHVINVAQNRDMWQGSVECGRLHDWLRNGQLVQKDSERWCC